MIPNTGTILYDGRILITGVHVQHIADVFFRGSRNAVYLKLVMCTSELRQLYMQQVSISATKQCIWVPAINYVAQNILEFLEY